MQRSDTQNVVADNVTRLLDGRTRKWLATRLDVSEMYLSRRMSGKAEWSASDLVALSEVLVTSPTELLSEPGPQAVTA